MRWSRRRTGLPGPNRAHDVAFFGKHVSHRLLVPDFFVVGDDDEIASAASDELHLNTRERTDQAGLQTGGSRFVVSNAAILDADSHNPEPNARWRRSVVPERFGIGPGFA